MKRNVPKIYKKGVEIAINNNIIFTPDEAKKIATFSNLKYMDSIYIAIYFGITLGYSAKHKNIKGV